MKTKSKHFTSNLAALVTALGLYVGLLLSLCYLDGGSVLRALESAIYHSFSALFLIEIGVVVLAMILTFTLAFSLSVFVASNQLLTRIGNTFGVLLKVTPALALTPIMLRLLPRHWSMEFQVYCAVILTAVLVAFYPIFGHAMRAFERAQTGPEGRFVKLVGAKPLSALRIIYLPRMLRGAIEGTVPGFPLVVIGVVVGEMIVSSGQANIGYIIQASIHQGDASSAVGAVLATTLLGLLAFGVSRMLLTFAHRA